MPNQTIEGNQANYNRRYKPLDTSEYHNQQAQAYYERMRSQTRKRSRSIMRGGGFRTTGGQSAYQTFGPMYSDPSRASYRTRTQKDQEYADDVSERVMQAPVDAYKSFRGVAAELTVGQGVETAVGNALYRGGQGAAAGAGAGGFAGSYIGSTLTGVAAGTAAAGGAVLAGEAAMRYNGVYGAFGQFGEMDKLQQASRPMMAGVAADSRGRMGDPMSQNITSDIAETSRIGLGTEEDLGMGQLKKEIGILSDNRLLEGVKDAEDFKEKFGKLREGVKKITEILGSTFEEGADMLKDFRNMGVGPNQGIEMLNQGRLTSAKFGTNFRQGHASGMQTMTAMRGTGFTAGAGYAMGQYAQGAAEQIYEGGHLSDKDIYNMGGKTGIRQKLQRGTMKMAESAPFTAMMMGSMNDNGDFDLGRIIRTMAGDRSLTQNAAAANNNIDSVEDILSYRANQQEAVSELMEENPQVMDAMKVQTVMGQAERMGMNPQNLTKGQLSQLAPQVGLNPSEFKAAAASVEASGNTQGREERERKRVSEGRAQDLFHTSFLSRAMEGFRESGIVQSLTRGSAEAIEDTRESVYQTRNTISDFMMRTFQGKTQFRMSGDTMGLLSDMELEGADPSMNVYRTSEVQENTPDSIDISGIVEQEVSGDTPSAKEMNRIEARVAERVGVSKNNVNITERDVEAGELNVRGPTESPGQEVDINNISREVLGISEENVSLNETEITQEDISQIEARVAETQDINPENVSVTRENIREGTTEVSRTVGGATDKGSSRIEEVDIDSSVERELGVSPEDIESIKGIEQYEKSDLKAKIASERDVSTDKVSITAEQLARGTAELEVPDMKEMNIESAVRNAYGVGEDFDLTNIEGVGGTRMKEIEKKVAQNREGISQEDVDIGLSEIRTGTYTTQTGTTTEEIDIQSVLGEKFDIEDYQGGAITAKTLGQLERQIAEEREGVSPHEVHLSPEQVAKGKGKVSRGPKEVEVGSYVENQLGIDAEGEKPNVVQPQDLSSIEKKVAENTEGVRAEDVEIEGQNIRSGTVEVKERGKGAETEQINIEDAIDEYYSQGVTNLSNVDELTDNARSSIKQNIAEGREDVDAGDLNIGAENIRSGTVDVPKTTEIDISSVAEEQLGPNYQENVTEEELEQVEQKIAQEEGVRPSQVDITQENLENNTTTIQPSKGGRGQVNIDDIQVSMETGEGDETEGVMTIKSEQLVDETIRGAVGATEITLNKKQAKTLNNEGADLDVEGGTRVKLRKLREQGFSISERDTEQGRINQEPVRGKIFNDYSTDLFGGGATPADALLEGFETGRYDDVDNIAITTAKEEITSESQVSIPGERAEEIGLREALQSETDAEISSEGDVETTIGQIQEAGFSSVLGTRRNARGDQVIQDRLSMNLSEQVRSRLNAFSRFTGTFSNEIRILNQRQLQETQNSSRRFAQGVADAFQGEAPTKISEIPDKYQDLAFEMSEKFKNISDSKLQDYLQNRGESGTSQFGTEIQKVLNKQFGIEGDVGTDEFENNAAEILNNEGTQTALQYSRATMRSNRDNLAIDKLFRDGTMANIITGEPTTVKRNYKDVKELYQKRVRGQIDMGEEDEGTRKTMRTGKTFRTTLGRGGEVSAENEELYENLTDQEGKDDFIKYLALKNIKPENLEGEGTRKERLKTFQTQEVKPEEFEIMEEVRKNLSPEKQSNILRTAKKYGELAGIIGEGGMQEEAASGVQVREATTENTVDELTGMAVDSTKDALKSLATVTQKNLAIQSDQQEMLEKIKGELETL